jgi:transglutaminase-like putative cysteine protease
MRYRVTHTTTYAYDEIVSIGHNEVRLEPRATPRQRCLATKLEIDPTPAVLSPELDYFGNRASFFTLQEPHHRMLVTASSELEIVSAPPLRPELTPAWDDVRSALPYDTSVQGLAAFEMSLESPLVPLLPEFAEFAASSFEAGRPILAAVLDLTARIHEDFEYRPGATSVTTPAIDVLAQRFGVCQDFAHVEIACLRALGLPARYVSGYIRTRAAPGRERLVGADASHAWLSVWLGDAGWIDLDPTNDLIADDQHVTLAWGRDYGDVAPIKGVILGGGGHSVEVAVEVEEIEAAEPPTLIP